MSVGHGGQVYAWARLDPSKATRVSRVIRVPSRFHHQELFQLKVYLLCSFQKERTRIVSPAIALTPLMSGSTYLSWHERIIYRASGVKLILCGHGKGRRDLSAEHSMRITVGYGDPARGQARKLLRVFLSNFPTVSP